MTSLPLSVIVLAHNEEKLLADALESVVGWVGEIFVVDSGSTDKTLEIARRYTSNIISHPFENYAVQRNWAQDNLELSYDWVMHLDADERVTPELRKSLTDYFAGPALDSVYGFLVARRTVFMGQWIRHGGHYPVYHTRIFRRQHGRCEERLYDQHFVVEGPTVMLKGDLIDNIAATLTSWSARHLRWASLEAEEQLRKSVSSARVAVVGDAFGNPIEKRRWWKASFYGRSPLFFRALAYFMYRYFLRLGFLDGTPGLIFHVLQGFWFRFYVDALIYEKRLAMRVDLRTQVDPLDKS